MVEKGEIEIKNKMDNNKILSLIKETTNYINKIDQILHNDGINKLYRLDILKKILINIKNHNFILNDIPIESTNNIINIMNNVLFIIPISEISQQLFMFYGSIILKNTLDQFYTPITISSFINDIVYKDKKYIDPAGGTGDLLVELEGDINIWEISPEAIEMAKLNYDMRGKKVTILNTNSLTQDIPIDGYDYCMENPPFGTKTITTDKIILNKYELGINREKQEIGILFIELGIKLLKMGGIMFAIVPGGYLGNNNNKYFRDYLIENTRILSIIKLPSATFSRSGTGVSTYLIVLSKNIVKDMNYNIHISEIDEIGYVLNKKNTPLKYKLNKDGSYMLIDNKLVIDNDFKDVSKQIKKFAFDNNIFGLINDNDNIEYDKCNISDILNDDNHIMETGRYIKKYKDAIGEIENKENATHIKNLCEKNINYSFIINKHYTYKYIDISQVNTPLYNGYNILGSKLPGRAKNKVKKNDIIISRLRGNVSYSVILEDDVIVTNGMCVLRPTNMKNLLIILSNIKTDNFNVQHQSLTTGSIMETISDKDINNILITKDTNLDNYKKIYEAMFTLKKLLC
jgi:predicted RNA methylase